MQRTMNELKQMPTYIDPKDGKRMLDKEYYIHHPANGLELYFGELTNRFAVFTGNIIQDQPLMDCTDAILHTLNNYMQKPAPPSPLEKKADSVIAKLRAQKNATFSALFDDGQRSHCSW